jgi:hypothetical protein
VPDRLTGTTNKAIRDWTELRAGGETLAAAKKG